MNTTDQLFNNTILFQDTENIEGTVKNPDFNNENIKGTVKNLDSNNENIKCISISPEELFNFAMSDAATNIVSDSISYWTEYMRKALK